MKTVKRKFYIIDRGIILSTYSTPIFNWSKGEYEIRRTRNYAAIEAAIKCLIETI